MEQWQLPDGWEWKPLPDICEVNPPRPRIQRSDDAPTSFVPMQAVDDVEGKIFDLQTRPYGEIKRGYTYFEENDVLLAKITPSMENGKAAVAQGLIDGFGFGTTEFHVFHPCDDISPKWIFYYVRRQSFRMEAKSRFRGAVGQQRVPEDFLTSYNIPIPYPNEPVHSLEIQRRIVTRLEALLAAIAEARGLQEKIVEDTGQVMDSFLRQVFEQDLSKRDTCQLVDVCNITMGQSPPGNSYSSQAEGLPLLNGPTEYGIEHPTPEQWTVDSKRECQVGDLLFCVRGATTGKMNWADQVYSIGRGLAALCSKPGATTNMKFVYFVLLHQSEKILGAGHGSTFPNFSKTQLESLVLPILSPDEQALIAHYLETTQEEIKELQIGHKENSELIAQLEQSFLAQAFRGEL